MLMALFIAVAHPHACLDHGQEPAALAKNWQVAQPVGTNRVIPAMSYQAPRQAAQPSSTAKELREDMS
jgi:hypothetical protein